HSDGRASSPLFPYTTLFRSRPGGMEVEVGDDPVAAELRHALRLAALPLACELPVEAIELAREVREALALGAGAGPGPLALPEGLDRKSTRLHSSHQPISSAV